jgi:DNA replication protein DnaC
MFAGGWRDDLLKEKMEKMIRNVDFLVVDDLGKEFKAQKINLNQAALDSVLRHRVYEQLPIIITTNRSTNEIETDYGAGTMSLFREACKIINVTGEDYRQKIRDSR